LGIYDREYVRKERTTRGGDRVMAGGRRAGFAGMFSVNTWLIIINVAVFMFGSTLRSGVPVLVVGADLPEGTNKAMVIEASEFQRSEQPGVFGRPVGVRDEKTSRVAVAQLPALKSAARDRNREVWITRQIDSGTVEVATVKIVGRNLYRTMDPLQAYGHFSTAKGFFGLEVWRLVTFQFLHANFMHLFFNMFGLYIFGAMVEQYLGRRRYLAFYLVSGVFGGVAYLALNILGEGLGLRAPGLLINDIHTPLVGASAGVFAVIVACAYIAPSAVVHLLFPPIPLRLKYFAYGYVAIAAISLLRGASNAGGDAAHLGGAIAGYFFIRNSHLLRDFFDIFGDSRRPKQGGRTNKKAGKRQREVDRILSKVRREGLDSLSAGDKRVLTRESEDQRRG